MRRRSRRLRPAAGPVDAPRRALAGAAGGERPPTGQETEITPDHLKHHQWTPNSDQWSYAERGRQDFSDPDSPVIQGPTYDTQTILNLIRAVSQNR